MIEEKEIIAGAIGATAIGAASFDYFSTRIPNLLTAGSTFLACIFFLFFSQEKDIPFMLLGLGMGFVLFFPLYLSSILGAGDVKCLMALGAWGGWNYCAHVALHSILLGGLFSFFLLCYRGEIFSLYQRLKNAWLVLDAGHLPANPLRKESRFCFGIPLCLAALWPLSSKLPWREFLLW